MKRYLLYSFVIVVAMGLGSCHTSKKDHVDPTSTETFTTDSDSNTDLSNKLGINISKSDKDNLKLYKVASEWLSVPYQYAGNTKKGCDCSGLVNQIYLEVYNKKLERNSAKIMETNCHEIQQDNLKPGDLVFFKTGSSSKINHVGIYLKDNKFIHASSSKGVIVSDMTERYYLRTYTCSGRVD